MAALIFVAAVVPLYGHNGLPKGFVVVKGGAHPWQDDNQQGGGPSVDQVIRIPVGPFVITMKIPTALLEKLTFKARQQDVKQPVSIPVNTNGKGQ